MNKLPHVSKEELLDAIRDGVSDAMWRMITNATSMPCADFFDTVKDGVTQGMKAAIENGKDQCSNPEDVRVEPQKSVDPIKWEWEFLRQLDQLLPGDFVSPEFDSRNNAARRFAHAEDCRLPGSDRRRQLHEAMIRLLEKKCIEIKEWPTIRQAQLSREGANFTPHAPRDEGEPMTQKPKNERGLRWGIVRYVMAGAAPYEDPCSFDGWYTHRETAKQVYELWCRQYPNWAVRWCMGPRCVTPTSSCR